MDDSLGVKHLLVELGHKIVKYHLKNVGLALVRGFRAVCVHLVDERFECLSLVVRDFFGYS
jgi:hypothetical protein